jgi:hypothetical protein
LSFLGFFLPSVISFLDLIIYNVDIYNQVLFAYNWCNFYFYLHLLIKLIAISWFSFGFFTFFSKSMILGSKEPSKNSEFGHFFKNLLLPCVLNCVLISLCHNQSLFSSIVSWNWKFIVFQTLSAAEWSEKNLASFGRTIDTMNESW